jgi:hypothetical protein
MTRAEVKHAIQNALPTPNVPDELVWEVLSECIAEQTGQPPRLVTLVESVQPPDAHARMRALLEASDTPRSDLKTDAHVNPPTTDPFLPDGIDLAAAIRRGAEGYKAAGIPINKEPATQKPLILTESREALAQRIPDPIQRAYLIMSGRAS